MNSPDSLAAVSSKAALDTNGSKPYSRLMQLRGGSHTLAEKFGLAPGQNVFKYIDQAECQVSRDAKPLHGAEVDVREGELQLWYCQGAPIAAPVARVAVGGGNVQLVAPHVHAVDIYVEVDGAPRTDGHVCFGADAGASKSAAIAAATKKTLYGEMWMDRFLTDGPSDGSKPWATIVRSDRWGESDGYVYLPLMANDVDNALMGDDTLTYAHALMAKWAALLKDVGEGKHEFALAIRPPRRRVHGRRRRHDVRRHRRRRQRRGDVREAEPDRPSISATLTRRACARRGRCLSARIRLRARAPCAKRRRGPSAGPRTR
jgi:hypothetical protein